MRRGSDSFPRVLLALLAVLLPAVPVYMFLPLSTNRHQTLYLLIAAGAVVIGFLGLRHHRPNQWRGWFLLLLGCAGWVGGDLVWTFEQHLMPGRYPAPSDLLYLFAYLSLCCGAMVFVWARPAERDVAAILDAAIITTGAGVLVGVFLLAPLGADSSLSPTAKAVSSAYPLADLFLLGVLTRMFSAAGAKTLSYRLLTGALTLTLLADVGYEVTALTSGKSTSPNWSDGAWLIAYVLIATAACVPSMKRLDDPGPDRSGPIPTRGRLVALAGGLMLPGIVLLLDGAAGGEIDWPVIGLGTVLLSCLVLIRMDGLLHIVQIQSVRLSALARSDFLTGAPNRRTWDHELRRACKLSLERDTSLCVAMLDLDRFKTYNDTHGHPAGDRLLREAVAAWTEVLPTDALLARYGGEEFAVLVPAVSTADLVQILHGLRAVTPGGQTFSAGVAVWDARTDPAVAVAGADQALYAAKRAGRDRILVHGQSSTGSGPARGLPAFTMVTQPIVDLTTSTVTSHEALARFSGPDADSCVEEVFRRAHSTGDGDLLELAAIRAALALPGRPADHDLFVNVSARAVVSQRFLTGLPPDLSELVFELNENPDDVEPLAVAAALSSLRARGARIALDDIGAGGHEFARLANLRPDVIKVDRSLVAGCAGDNARSAVLLALVVYARRLGVMVCAEGVEEIEDLDHLMELGITHAQGHLLAAPGRSWRPPTPVPLRRRQFFRPTSPETVG
jgi:diguanylate cyclase (GGDEF)-like protein